MARCPPAHSPRSHWLPRRSQTRPKPTAASSPAGKRAARCCFALCRTGAEASHLSGHLVSRRSCSREPPFVSGWARVGGLSGLAGSGGRRDSELAADPRAVPVGISRCRGTGVLKSCAGLAQIVWLAPSRSSRQPWLRRCASSSRRFKPRGRSLLARRARRRSAARVPPGGRRRSSRAPRRAASPGPPRRSCRR